MQEKLSKKKLNLRNTRIQFGPVCINPSTHCHIIPYGQITSSKLREGFNHSQHDLMINTLCERFEARGHFISWLSIIVCRERSLE